MRFGNVDSEYQITAREQPVPSYQRVTNATGLPLNWNDFAVMLLRIIPPTACLETLEAVASKYLKGGDAGAELGTPRHRKIALSPNQFGRRMSR
jgi:hypothetical protein